MKKDKIISIFFTAGYPETGNVNTTIDLLIKRQINMVEIGIPFSDPVADGTVIQKSSQIAIANNMTLQKIFDELSLSVQKQEIKKVLMGYFNTILQFGVSRFLHKCSECKITSVIIPDLPLEEYSRNYQELFLKFGVKNIFMVTPQTSDERIYMIDRLSEDFIYVVGQQSITGQSKPGESRDKFLRRLYEMGLKSKLIVGFGIQSAEDIRIVNNYADGVIIGSAFIRAQEENRTEEFLDMLKN